MPDTFTIDTDVPIVAVHENKWPFPEMEVGNSFLIGRDDRQANNCRSSAIHWSYRTDVRHKFRVRKTPDGYRCWRVA